MEKLPQFVIGRLRQAKSQPAVLGFSLNNDAHPDADLLTAFAERSLREAEREPVMRHLAVCHDCREIVMLALPEAEMDILPTYVSTGQSPGWFRWPALQWGALAAGVLAVAMVALQHGRQSRPEIAANAGVGDSRTVAVQTPVTSNSQTDTVASSQPEAKSAPLQAPPRHVRHSRADSGEALLARNETPQIGSPSNDLDIVKAKDPVSAQAQSPLSTPPPELQTSPMMMKRASPRWAVTAKGTLERSFDGGSTWESIDPTADAMGAAAIGRNFLAVSASGLEVWAGGSAGMLYHTSDSGAHWTLVHPADSLIALTGDITNIDFSDSQHGRVSTSTREQWITADAGQTWRREP
jgi:hypothetical protein